MGSSIRYEMIAFMSLTSVPFTHLLPFPFLFLLLLVRNAWSLGVDFTVPAGGATWPAGPITVKWSDVGGYPDESDLVAYTLELMVGGNSQSNSEIIQTIGKPNGTVSDGSVEDEIAADMSQSIQNGFYLRMTSNTTTGDQVINYSQRFTLIDMNGTTDSAYLEGANEVSGDSANVPEAQYNMLASPVSTATPTATSSSTPIATATAPSTAPSGQSDVESTGGLPRGTLPGIITGGMLVLIWLVSLFTWVVFVRGRAQRKRVESRPSKQDQEEIIHEHITPTFSGHKAELAAHRTSGLHFTQTRELSAQNERFEMNDQDKMAEVPASPIVYELESSWSGWEGSSGRRSKAYDPTL